MEYQHKRNKLEEINNRYYETKRILDKIDNTFNTQKQTKLSFKRPILVYDSDWVTPDNISDLSTFYAALGTNSPWLRSWRAPSAQDGLVKYSICAEEGQLVPVFIDISDETHNIEIDLGKVDGEEKNIENKLSDLNFNIITKTRDEATVKSLILPDDVKNTKTWTSDWCKTVFYGSTIFDGLVKPLYTAEEVSEYSIAHPLSIDVDGTTLYVPTWGFNGYYNKYRPDQLSQLSWYSYFPSGNAIALATTNESIPNYFKFGRWHQPSKYMFIYKVIEWHRVYYPENDIYVMEEGEVCDNTFLITSTQEVSNFVEVQIPFNPWFWIRSPWFSFWEGRVNALVADAFGISEVKSIDEFIESNKSANALTVYYNQNPDYPKKVPLGSYETDLHIDPIASYGLNKVNWTKIGEGKYKPKFKSRITGLTKAKKSKTMEVRQFKCPIRLVNEYDYSSYQDIQWADREGYLTHWYGYKSENYTGQFYVRDWQNLTSNSYNIKYYTGDNDIDYRIQIRFNPRTKYYEVPKFEK